MNLLRRLRLMPGESGQATIFVAILLSTLMGITGLAIEGGSAVVQYRKLQSAADMAALIGAQNLPCATTDSTCITTAENLACTYATNNGFSGCTAGGAAAPSANVPPLTCSPYDFIDYGNGSTNAHCKSATTPPFYSYIEVQLNYSYGNVPIFNTPVTLSARAIAKHGFRTGNDYTIITLSTSTPFDMTGAANVNVVGSVFTNGGIVGNNKGQSACDGAWLSAGTVSGVATNTTGTPVWAPAGCTGSSDSTADTIPSQAQITDPYASSSAPPTQPIGSSFPNCPECSQAGYYYDLNAKVWHQGGNISSGTSVELFPGVYGSFAIGNSDYAIFNPGVYTFTGGMDTNHGVMCTYGAPACANSSCQTDNFSPGTTAANQYYYSCSPYGFWDGSTVSGTRPAGLPVSAPTFWNSTTGASSTTPLNGVTFYMPSGSGGIDEHGNSGKTAGVYWAAPDPCSGTGTFTTGSVSFPAGSTSGIFSAYPANGWSLPHGTTTSPTGQVYPNADFSLLGECNSPLMTWPGEFTAPQHAHFLFYMPGTGNNVIMNGANSQNFSGIFYAPGSSVSLSGAGKGGGGPPWISGQLVANTVSVTGSAYVDVSYRPCGPGSTSCGNGIGTQLVQ